MLTNVITCGMVGGKVSHLYIELVQAFGLDKYPTHAEFFQVTVYTSDNAVISSLFAVLQQFSTSSQKVDS